MQLLDNEGNKVGSFDTGENKIYYASDRPLNIYIPRSNVTPKWEFTLEKDNYYRHHCHANCPITDLSDFTDADIEDYSVPNDLGIPGYSYTANDNAIEVRGSGTSESSYVVCK